jgi:molecular chaperone GrpE
MSFPKNPVPRDRDHPTSRVVRDKRRIDRVSLQLRREAHQENAGAPPPERAGREGALMLRAGTGTPAPSPDATLRRQLEERTADLQRLKSEYTSYRKRMHRDRLAVRQIAVSNVLAGLLPVLDALEQARKHGELHEGSAAIADMLESRLAALGLQPVGEPGELFDPTAHEALTYSQSSQIGRPVCTAVLRRGYRVGDHLLRPAQVTVSGPPGCPARTRAEVNQPG